MRFTRIPLIATLLAGALSLLVVLPAIAQSTLGEETDGRLNVAGALEVQVYQNIADIRARGVAAADADSSITEDDATSPNPDATPRTAVEGPTTTTIARGDQALGLRDSSGDNAFDYSRVPDPRNTYFNQNLYVSNDDDAYNTILITAQVADSRDNSALRRHDDDPDGIPGNDDDHVDDLTTTEVDESNDGWNDPLTGAEYDCVIAEAKNTRSGRKAEVTLLAVGGAGDSAVPANSAVYQGILTVWDRSTDRVEERNSRCDKRPLADPEIQTDPDNPIPWRTAGASGTQPAAVVAARDGDTIEITVEGIRGRLLLTVDGDAPTVTGLSPEDGGTTNSDRVTLGLTVSDDGAGLRFDSEDGSSGDGDSSPANGDNDQRFNEPLTIADSDPSTAGWQPPSGATSTIQGATEDIQVYYADDITDGTTDDTSDGQEHTLGHQPNVPAQEFSGYGTSGWTQVEFGRSYRLSMVLNSQAFDSYEWMVVARDRVGNSFTTDGDDDESGPQPFTFTLDDEDPTVNNVRTGVKFDASSSPPKEKADRSWIALTVVNEETTGTADRVDRSSVEASDFTVSGATVVEAVVPTTKRVCKMQDEGTEADETAKNVLNLAGDCLTSGFDPRATIYLRLSEELEADEKPTVQMLGGVFRDVAGNPNEVKQLSGASVEDKIAPRVSITVTASGEATNRPATNSKGEFTIRVTSDEDLRRFPTVYFAEIDGVADADDATVATGLQVDAGVQSITPTELERNVWERKIKADSDDLPGAGSRLIAVLVAAEDEDQNRGNSAGWTPHATLGTAPEGTNLDFKKLADGGYLIEIDNALAVPASANVTVQPAVQGESKVTESLTPYVEIKFEGEKNEYGIAARAGDGPFYKADAGDDEDPIKTDSHEGVTLTKLTVDGEDRLADVRRVGSEKGRFILAFVEGLSLGKHTVVYAAKDDVGNEFSANSAGAKERSFSFTVRARAGYKVNIRPGWNLISLPGTPTNPAVSAVLEGLQANTALSYQNGEWLSALRGEDGEWQGTLEQIAGGYGYWIQTTAAETITTVIPPTLPNQVLPTVPITSGWNLVGVIDAGQRSAGTTQDPDRYFVNVSWRVAYGFDTAGSRWTKILPAPSTDDNANDSAIANGKGYWLWSTEPGTLVP